jgi:hypothetical protein
VLTGCDASIDESLAIAIIPKADPGGRATH